jgi:TonB family protein
MSTTQIPPRSPAQLPPRSDGSDLYDARRWESAYRQMHEAPTLLVQLQDDLSRSRRREAFWLSVIFHLVVVILIVNSPKFAQLMPHRAVIAVNPAMRDKDLTYLELPPDEQKIAKPPKSDIISDKNRNAMSRAPQIDRQELKRILDASRPGRPGPGGAPNPQQPTTSAAPPSAQPAAQAPPPPPPSQDQIAKLQQPAPQTPKPSFNNSLSPGSAIAEATRNAAVNRGGYGGDSGDYGLGIGRRPTAAMGPMDILSDTMGVDFGPYLERVLHAVKQNWYNLIPESARAPLMKKGDLSIEFAIMKDGRVQGMTLVKGSGDVALDRGAWGGITASNPFPPLPSEFGGQYLALRFHFFYNPDKGDLENLR